MKHTKLSWKVIVLSSVLLVIVLCVTFYLGAASSTNNSKNGGIVTYADLTPFEKQKLDKESELKSILRNFDKKNIVETWVFLGNSGHEIIDASIFIVSHEEITNSAEKDELMSLASESLNLDIENIYITYMDVESFTSPEK